MLEFQRTMSHFLDTQRRVMLAFLGGETEADALSAPGSPGAAALPPPAMPSRPPARRPRRPCCILSARRRSRPARQPVAPPPTGADEGAAAGPPAIERELVRVVSERTGYPPEMLGLDLDLEADLGIDSIKRVEILGALQRAVPAPVAEAIKGQLETLTKAKTLRRSSSAWRRRGPRAPGPPRRTTRCRRRRARATLCPRPGRRRSSGSWCGW